jgi:enamine deaminase RidA (YjgF/YER057c/UK114 family)
MGADPHAVICRTIPHADWDELHLTVPSHPARPETAHDVLLRAVSAMHTAGADVVHANVFGMAAPGGTPLTAPRGVPASIVEGAPCGEPGRLVAGVQAVGARGAAVTAYDPEEGVSVVVIEDAQARWAYVTGIHPAKLWATQFDQARDAFDRAAAALTLAGMDFTQVVRTWVYVEDILAWYGDLNRARTAFYREHGVFDGIVPASTGVGARNPMGAAVTLNLLALAPTSDAISITRVPSPLQCSAEEYGSSFSRALEIGEPGLRRLIVSGTASIAPDGRTAHVGDLDAQIELTMDVVEAILVSRGMGWPDVTRAVAYFRAAEDASAYEAFRARRGLPHLPLVVTECTICRDDLLFELEADAVSTVCG